MTKTESEERLVHVPLGERIDRVALVHQVFQRLLGVLGLQQRPMIALVDPLPQYLEIGLQPHRDATALDLLARLLVDEGAAASRNDPRTGAQQALDDPRLEGAELLFAIGGKEFADRHARDALDLIVGVDEGQPELVCGHAADRRLAGSHQADEDEIAPSQRRPRAFTQWRGNGKYGFVHRPVRIRFPTVLTNERQASSHTLE